MSRSEILAPRARPADATMAAAGDAGSEDELLVRPRPDRWPVAKPGRLRAALQEL